MRRARPVWAAHVKAVTAALVTGLLVLATPAAYADAPAVSPAAYADTPAARTDVPALPELTDGFGLTQTAPATGTATNFVITVTTPQVAGERRIRILLPAGYADDPTRRYPVLYFLHGASDGPGNPALAYPALTAAQSMITVIPDGGLRGWYTNWLDQKTAAGAQNWRNFHLDQVIPFIDANLRTLATKAGRAVGGLSMGGFGALHYAQTRPELFSQVATLSGATDLSRNHAVMRGAVVGTLTNAGMVLCGKAGPTCALDFGPTVSSDAIFGTPYPVFDADWRWNAADPSSHMGALAGMKVSLYTGSGNGEPANMEFWVRSAAERARNGLAAHGIPYHYVDYGNGANWGKDCNGGHSHGCWAQDLVDLVPRLEAGFATS